MKVRGYRIKDGVVEIDKDEADKIRTLYNSYLQGESIAKAGKKAGLEFNHPTLGRILKNKNYLGNNIFPQIIEEELYYKVQKEREERAIKMGRVFERKEKTRIVPVAFQYKNIKANRYEPIKKAEYIHSRIMVMQ